MDIVNDICFQLCIGFKNYKIPNYIGKLSQQFLNYDPNHKDYRKLVLLFSANSNFIIQQFIRMTNSISSYYVKDLFY